jgi:hypothetical protein
MCGAGPQEKATTFEQDDNGDWQNSQAERTKERERAFIASHEITGGGLARIERTAKLNRT